MLYSMQAMPVCVGTAALRQRACAMRVAERAPPERASRTRADQTRPQMSHEFVYRMACRACVSKIHYRYTLARAAEVSGETTGPPAQSRHETVYCISCHITHVRLRTLTKRRNLYRLSC